MKKQSSYLLGILVTIVVGTVLYINYCSTCAAPENSKVVEAQTDQLKKTQSPFHPFSVNDDSYMLDIEDNFSFNSSEPSFMMPLSDQLKKGVEDLKNYLGSHPDKMVQVTGLYAKGETNNSDFVNLGVARANSVKNHLVMNGISVDQIQTDGKLDGKLKPLDNVLFGPIFFQLSERDPIENDSEPN
ncbi:OmpA family protein [Flagellimonas meishanensis]|uniref:OmpA family protein n=1 Tax=Flagellimonas meishanensis TaxID=2873264 RepID=UPI001CA77617|nr:hypothetical protein [[Muricauda] meishanensis]